MNNFSRIPAEKKCIPVFPASLTRCSTATCTTIMVVWRRDIEHFPSASCFYEKILKKSFLTKEKTTALNFPWYTYSSSVHVLNGLEVSPFNSPYSLCLVQPCSNCWSASGLFSPFSWFVSYFLTPYVLFSLLDSVPALPLSSAAWLLPRLSLFTPSWDFRAFWKEKSTQKDTTNLEWTMTQSSLLERAGTVL